MYESYVFRVLTCSDIYNDRKNNLFQEKLIVPSRELREDADEWASRRDPTDSCHLATSSRALRKLNLPSSLDALERPVGLPPSLLRKAEEVRLEDGPSKIQVSIDDVERLAHHNFAILEEVSYPIRWGKMVHSNTTPNLGIRHTRQWSVRRRIGAKRLPTNPACIPWGERRTYREIQSVSKYPSASSGERRPYTTKVGWVGGQYYWIDMGRGN